MRLPLEIVRRVRAAVGEDFIIIFRLSMLDLVEGGSSAAEVLHGPVSIVGEDFPVLADAGRFPRPEPVQGMDDLEAEVAHNPLDAAAGSN